MKTFMLSDVECPQVIFEVDGHEIESTVIKNVKKTPNFDSPLLFLDVVGVQIAFDLLTSSSADVTQRRSLCPADEHQSERSSILRPQADRRFSRDQISGTVPSRSQSALTQSHTSCTYEPRPLGEEKRFFLILENAGEPKAKSREVILCVGDRRWLSVVVGSVVRHSVGRGENGDDDDGRDHEWNVRRQEDDQETNETFPEET